MEMELKQLKTSMKTGDLLKQYTERYAEMRRQIPLKLKALKLVCTW